MLGFPRETHVTSRNIVSAVTEDYYVELLARFTEECLREGELVRELTQVRRRKDAAFVAMSAITNRRSEP
jgi:hypothetical protein